MARHDKHSSDDAEDHGVLDDQVVDATNLNVLGLPTSQVKVHLPRGYEDVDDDDVVDDGPEGLSGGSIVLDLPGGADDESEHSDDADAEQSSDADESSEAEPATTPESAEDEGDGEPEADDPAESDAGADVEESAEPEDEVEESGDEADESAPDEAVLDEADAPADEAEPDAGEPAEATDADDAAVDDAEPADAPIAEPAEPGPAEEPAAAGDGDAADAPTTEQRENVDQSEKHEPAEPEGDAADQAEDTELPLEAEVGDAPDQGGAAEPETAAPAPEPQPAASGRTPFVAQSAASTRPGGAERAEQLTSDRLIDHQSKTKPEGAWRGFVYRVTGGLVNLGDSRSVRERKELLASIAGPLPGRARFVPVLSRKGGVGKTTVTTLLGMALADARDDRVVAVDANPDRGTLAERIAAQTSRTVRDVVRHHDRIRGYADISDLVARDETRLDIVASETDPHIADAFDDADYRTVAEVAAQYYSLVLTDTGTGIIHSVMDATLDLADQLVVVAGASVDESRLASETLTWLEAHGHEALVKNAIVILNQSAPGRSLVRLDEVEAHFASRVRAVVRIPYDERLATGGAIAFGDLHPTTRRAARQAAAHVVEGMRTSALHAFGGER